MIISPGLSLRLSRPSIPTLTAPANNANVFITIPVTVSATSTDLNLDRIDWVLDPGGSEVVVATDATSPYSQSWTPTGITLGAHTLVARAVRGAQSTDSASITVNVGVVLQNLVSSVTCLRNWQSDFGVTTAGTPLASGTAPPVVTLATVPASVGFRLEIQTTGARGTATFRYSADSGVTWIEQNVVTAATYNAIGALAGAVITFPIGAYVNDNVYVGMCSGWVDSKNSVTANDGGSATKRPAIVANAVGTRLALRFDGATDVLADTTLNLPAPGTTASFYWMIFKQSAWTSGSSVCSAGTAGTMRVGGLTSTPNMAMTNSVNAPLNGGATLGTLVRGEARFNNNAADYLKLGATSVTGTAGNTDPPAGFNIGSATIGGGAGLSFNGDIFAELVFAGIPSGAELAALSSAAAAMYPGVSV